MVWQELKPQKDKDGKLVFRDVIYPTYNTEINGVPHQIKEFPPINLGELLNLQNPNEGIAIGPDGEVAKIHKVPEPEQIVNYDDLPLSIKRKLEKYRG